VHVVAERAAALQGPAAVEGGAAKEISSLVTPREDAGERKTELVLLAAGALLALVMASGSFATMAAKTIRGSAV
jgi:hypothetical protein